MSRGRRRKDGEEACDGVVAIVDDDPSVRRSLRSLFASVDIPTRTFSSAEAFLAAGVESSSACLILDVRMPGMGGEELLRRVASSCTCTPVIILSGLITGEQRERLLRDGAVAVLTKPFPALEMLKAVRAVLRVTRGD